MTLHWHRKVSLQMRPAQGIRKNQIKSHMQDISVNILTSPRITRTHGQPRFKNHSSIISNLT